MRIVFHLDGFKEMRHSTPVVARLIEIASSGKAELDAELREAEAGRKQRPSDGYDWSLTTGGTRARAYINAASARAMAHENAHSSLLKWAFRNGGKPGKKKPGKKSEGSK